MKEISAKHYLRIMLIIVPVLCLMPGITEEDFSDIKTSALKDIEAAAGEREYLFEYNFTIKNIPAYTRQMQVWFPYVEINGKRFSDLETTFIYQELSEKEKGGMQRRDFARAKVREILFLKEREARR